MTKPWIRVLLWLLTLATAATIFGFSGQEGEQSLGLSHRLVQPIVDYVRAHCPEMTQAESDSLYETLQQIVRKGGHLAEYALLGLWGSLLGKSYALRRRKLTVWGLGTLYAVTDELHQCFSPDRSPAVLDVCIDSLGVGIGMSIVALLFFRKKKEER